MVAIFLTDKKENISKAYSPEAITKIGALFSLEKAVYSKADLCRKKELAAQVTAIFSTWGMPTFTQEEIKSLLPNLKYVFYAAGSVQHFAKEFLACGVRVFSASSANAIPVAQFVLGQILLANKGAFQAMQKGISHREETVRYASCVATNYKPKIGIIGVGTIGKLVVELLRKTLDCEIYYYDPFLSEEAAQSLGIHKADLAEIFASCDCISNHLADKDELAGILDYHLFAKMKPYATFLNTARGRQVDENGLVRAMMECTTRTAVLDVTYLEPPVENSPITQTPNIFLTPHIAGSLGREVARMGDNMVGEAQRILQGELPLCEVTTQMLETMA